MKRYGIMLKGKHILLGITGSIAAYKAAMLCRLLKTAGAEVRVVMTPTAKEFITPVTMATLSKNPIAVEFYNPENGDWHLSPQPRRTPSPRWLTASPTICCSRPICPPAAAPSSLRRWTATCSRIRRRRRISTYSVRAEQPSSTLPRASWRAVCRARVAWLNPKR